jgi:deaminated glutathione amidase
MTFRAALLQMRSGRQIGPNIDSVAKAMRDAKAAGAVYLQTPEMTTIIERDRAALLAAIGDDRTNPELDALRTIARENGLYLHVGSMAVRIGDKAANRAFVIDPSGDVVAQYDKIHLFDVDLAGGESWRESNSYQGGTEAVVANLPFARVGLAICYDVRFPQLFRAYGDAGVEVLTIPAAFTRQTGEAHWHVLQRARAIENGAFVLSAAQAGLHEDGRETYGHTIAIDPWGRVMTDAGSEPGLSYVDIDTAQVHAARAKIPNLKNARPFAMREASTSMPRAAE